MAEATEAAAVTAGSTAALMIAPSLSSVIGRGRDWAKRLYMGRSQQSYSLISTLGVQIVQICGGHA